MWLQDIESLEAILQDEDTCAICLRMAEMSHSGGLGPPLTEIELDRELDPETKATLTELASDELFLHAVEGYFRATSALH